MKRVSTHLKYEVGELTDELADYKKSIKKNLKYLAARPVQNVGALLSQFFNGFSTAVVDRRPPKEVLRNFSIYKTLALSNFRVGAGNEAFVANFDGTNVAFTPEAKTDYMSVDHWKDAYDACMIGRDMDGLRFLARVPERVFKDSNNGASDFDLAYYRFLAHFFTGGKETGDLLLAVMNEADKPQDNDVRQSFVELIRYPELLMLQNFVMGDAAEFSRALEKALKSHKKFWGSKENAFDTVGWISLPILSACAMASDAKQFPIEVESDYVPRWMVMGEGLR